MRRRAAIASLCGIAAAAALAGSAPGGGSAGPAPAFDSNREVRVIGPQELERVRAASAPAAAGRKSAKVTYFTTVNLETVVPGGDQLYEIRCPAKRQPMTGGILSASPGLAVTNSSRLSPDPDRPTISGAWYEGVTNLTATALQWRPVLVCLKS